MNKMKLFFVFTLGLIFALSGCNSTEDKIIEDPDTLTGEKISAKIDGVAWTSTEAVAAYLSSDKTLNLAGGNLNPGPNISVQIRKPAGLGTFNFIEHGTFTLTLNNKLYLAGVNVFNGKELGSGKITVTEVNNIGLIRGTFEAIVDDGQGNKKIISEGKFSGF